MTTLILDADGVLFDFVGGMLANWYDMTGKRVEPSSVTSWNITPSLGASLDEAMYLWSMAKLPGFCRNLRPTPGAQEAVQRLQKMARIVVCTAPLRESLTWCYERLEALENLYNVQAKDVILTSAKDLVHGDLFVDDDGELCTKWQKAWPSGRSLLWDTPRGRRGWLGPKTGSWGYVEERLRSYVYAVPRDIEELAP